MYIIHYTIYEYFKSLLSKLHPLCSGGRGWGEGLGGGRTSQLPGGAEIGNINAKRKNANFEANNNAT